jgi:hypothetical protein
MKMMTLDKIKFPKTNTLNQTIPTILLMMIINGIEITNTITMYQTLRNQILKSMYNIVLWAA